jgi:hypothetical protein
MLNMATLDAADQIVGISISPKIINGPNGTQRVGFYVIKVWNNDSEKYNTPTGIHLLHQRLIPTDILYTPHVDKKM